MDRSNRNRGVPLSANDPLFEELLDLRLQAMHRVLDAMKPNSAAVALRTLREVFPETPFDERARALAKSRH